MNKFLYYLINLLIYTSILILVVLVINLIGFTIYAVVTYGDTPINEVPTWVAWLLWRR